MFVSRSALALITLASARRNLRPSIPRSIVIPRGTPSIAFFRRPIAYESSSSVSRAGITICSSGVPQLSWESWAIKSVRRPSSGANAAKSTAAPFAAAFPISAAARVFRTFGNALPAAWPALVAPMRVPIDPAARNTPAPERAPKPTAAWPIPAINSSAG